MRTAPLRSRVISSCAFGWALGLALGGCGSSNAERPFPAEAGAPGAGGSVGGAGGSGMGGTAGDAPGAAGTGGHAVGGSMVIDALAGAGGTGATPTADAGSPDASGGSPDGGAGETQPGTCVIPPVPACDAPLPDPGPKRAWRDTFSPLAAIGAARHRGRDLFVPAGARQWVLAKFAYGPFDDDIENEDVDVHLLRDCGARWEKLGTARTTRDGQHPTVEDVPDDGGRIYFEIPPSMALSPGRHRVRLVVGGDLSATELFIEVVPPQTAVFVSDVDGTLTTSETAEFGSLLTAGTPEAHADAPSALRALAAKGYRPLYLTARPEWLAGRTREFLAVRGFPPGIVHTANGATGAVGGAATTFKTTALGAMALRGLRAIYAFGNTDSDAQAYANARIEPAANRVFFQYTDARYGGRRIDRWDALATEFETLTAHCP